MNEITLISKIEKCDICDCKITDVVYDGRTKSGPWAWMCEKCFHEYGVGLGTGLGQKFMDGRKVAG